MRIFGVFFLILLGLLGGCTTIGMQPYLEKNPEALARAKSIAGHPERATIFFYRRYPLGTPNPGLLPPYQFAVNGEVISAMPVGTYVVLSLPPGSHKLTRLAENRNKNGGFDAYDLNIETKAGQNYYVGASNGLSIFKSLQEDSPDAGESFLQHALLAKFYHQPIPLEALLNGATSVDSRRQGDNRPNMASSTTIAPQTRARSSNSNLTTVPNLTSSVLPTSQQITSVLETLAIIAFVGLLIVGGAAVAGTAGSGTALALADLASPPAYIATPSSKTPTQPMKPIPVDPIKPHNAVQETYRTSSGATAKIQQSTSRTIFNVSNGITYRIEDNRVYGSDGTSARMIGNTLIRDTGQSYQIIGNQIFSSDGRSCLVTGNVASCN